MAKILGGSVLKTKVIVISGVTAIGKTTLINALSDTVENAYVLSFDDYSIDALPSAPSHAFLLKNFNVAVNLFDITQLMKDFFSVNAQGKFNYIFIDFPFGYLHDDLKPFIDIVIYLKTPLDVCFARQVIRDYSYSQGESIIKWAHNYLNNVRPLFIEHEKNVSASSDYLLDGTHSVDEQIQKLKKLKVI
ncbi:nucleoside/nucleotide kinase family protein [Enterococcus faecalis]|uniref:adenylyl-sulfate kinase n=1 Tax=Enterococcus faecalis TaxID=1351 RepID=UPI00115C79B0|nr:adenylyl-sulfate kinase [Enterococcus faecalis]